MGGEEEGVGQAMWEWRERRREYGDERCGNGERFCKFHTTVYHPIPHITRSYHTVLGTAHPIPPHITRSYHTVLGTAHPGFESPCGRIIRSPSTPPGRAAVVEAVLRRPSLICTAFDGYLSVVQSVLSIEFGAYRVWYRVY
jgi:hypothetical protein